MAHQRVDQDEFRVAHEQQQERGQNELRRQQQEHDQGELHKQQQQECNQSELHKQQQEGGQNELHEQQQKQCGQDEPHAHGGLETDDELVLVLGRHQLVLAVEAWSEPSSFGDTPLGKNAVFSASIWPPSP